MPDSDDEFSGFALRADTEDRADRALAIGQLKSALDAFGGSATALAKKAGVSTSTITRPLKDPNGASLPKWATINKIVEAAGLGPTGNMGIVRGPQSLQFIEIVGELRPGVWFEDAEDREYGDRIYLSVEALRPAGVLSAFTVGPEGIPYPSGTRAIVDSGRAIVPGDTVVIRQVDGDEKVETFAVVYQFERARHVFLKARLDGSEQRFETAPLAKEMPDIGAIIGPVIATLWLKS